MTDVGPIFVCGASRSGTALLRACFNQHSRVHISGETHYFEHLRSLLAREGDLTDELRQQCEDYFLSLWHRPYGHAGVASLSRVPRAQYVDAIGSPVGGGAVEYGDRCFEAFCRLNASLDGRTIWGEKTPRHIYCIPDIIERFPAAKVICMVRDPRAVAASYANWRNQGGFDLEADPDHARALEEEERRAKRSYHPVLSAMLWRAAVRKAVGAAQRHGHERVRIQRYEDLIEDPQRSLKELVDWLGIAFEDSILDVPVLNSSFQSFDSKGGFAKGAVDRWKETLPRADIGCVQFVAGKEMRHTGFELVPSPSGIVPLAGRLAGAPVAAVRAFAANRRRIKGLFQYVWRRLAIGS